MIRLKLALQCCLLIYFLCFTSLFSQEFQFQREIDTIPVIVNGTAVQIPFISGFNYSKPIFEDIDSDGDLDLFVGRYDGSINFYRNEGTATESNFKLETENFADISVGKQSVPTLTDIDNDGDLDLFVGEQDGNINFYRNTGTVIEFDFILVTEMFAGIDVGSSTPAFTDIDNDGDLDLFVGESSGNINFYRNEGTGAEPLFTLETENLAEDHVGLASVPVLGDIDNDGDLDLFVGMHGGINVGDIDFYRNEGTATEPDFKRETASFADIDIGQLNAPTLADIDSDGDLDLFVGESEGNLNFFRNMGTPTEPNLILATTNFIGIDVGGCCSTPTFADIDNDGDLDLFVGEYDGYMNFFRNAGTSIEPVLILESPNFAGHRANVSTPTFADIENDGDLDLFVGEGELNGNIHFYRNEGTATEPNFIFETRKFASIWHRFYNPPTFEDIDNDGDLDLFVGDWEGNINFYRNEGTATEPDFKLETINFANIDIGEVSAPKFADIDKDGDLDLFIGERDGNINFFRNTGTTTVPSFAYEDQFFINIDVGSGSYPAFVDIDNDGDLDLFVGESKGGLQFYRNMTSRDIRGDVNFDGVVDESDLTSVIDFILGSVTPSDEQSAAADVNGDGIIDVRDLIAIIDIILGVG